MGTHARGGRACRRACPPKGTRGFETGRSPADWRPASRQNGRALCRPTRLCGTQGTATSAVASPRGKRRRKRACVTVALAPSAQRPRWARSGVLLLSCAVVGCASVGLCFWWVVQWWVVLGTGSSLRAHPHAVRTGCAKSFRQIGQRRLGSGGLSSSCSGSSPLVAICSRLRGGGGGGAGPAVGGATGRSQLVSLVSVFQK